MERSVKNLEDGVSSSKVGFFYPFFPSVSPRLRVRIAFSDVDSTRRVLSLLKGKWFTRRRGEEAGLKNAGILRQPQDAFIFSFNRFINFQYGQ